MRRQVLSFVKYDQGGASSRVRFWNLVPGLRELGWNVNVRPLLCDDILSRFYARGSHNYIGLGLRLLVRMKTLSSMGDPDVIWVEKELLPGLPGFLETRFWRPNANITVIDYDDAVFLNYSDKWAGQLGRAQKFEDYARGAARVVVGSANLKKQMDSWGSAQTTYVPSTVDVGAYPIHEHIDRRPIVIGWIGTPKTVHFLDCLREVFPAVARRFWIQLKIIGASWHCPGLEVRTFPWSKQTEAELVSSFDIGVMPLLDGAWERAKCGYKIIQYMAAGVVPVAARVGENKNIIQEGVNGYLASEPSEWVETLCRLCGDVQLRSEIAANSRKFAIAKYDVRVAVRATDAIFSAIGSPKRTPRL